MRRYPDDREALTPDDGEEAARFDLGFADFDLEDIALQQGTAHSSGRDGIYNCRYLSRLLSFCWNYGEWGC